MVSLDDLVKHITCLDKLIGTEEKVSAFFKQISKTVSDFDMETRDLLDVLHTQRDEQVTDYIRVLYLIVLVCIILRSRSFLPQPT